MHLLQSRRLCLEKAWVGQASMHLLQPEHWACIGLSGVSSNVVINSPSNSCEPRSGFFSIAFFPMKPSPARCAKARSANGTESTQGLNLMFISMFCFMNSASSKSMSLMKVW